jgi:hypothetical protein
MTFQIETDHPILAKYAARSQESLAEARRTLAQVRRALLINPKDSPADIVRADGKRYRNF